jgi:hypothetical protein
MLFIFKSFNFPNNYAEININNTNRNLEQSRLRVSPITEIITIRARDERVRDGKKLFVQ